MNAHIAAIEYYLPDQCLTNEDLARTFPEWSVEKIEAKTGISCRRIAAEDECSSDLGIAAASKLFAAGVCTPSEIDFLLFCTQSPDYFLPTTACIMQHRLGIPTSAGALDFNLGCSGYIYGLGLAKALVESRQATEVLLITAETYSKFIHPSDKSVRTIFGDAGAATLICGTEETGASIGDVVYGTDGAGANNLIVQSGGMRHHFTSSGESIAVDEGGNPRGPSNLFMNGSEIFDFTLDVVPDVVHKLLGKAGTGMEGVDLFVFHQANQYMLEHLRRKLKIPAVKFFIGLRNCGNTVSCTIPIALKQASEEGRIRSGDLVMLVGFGVGYSWGAALVRWV